VAGDVADHQHGRAVGQAERVVPVPAHLGVPGGGQVADSGLQVIDVRRRPEQVPLEHLGDLHRRPARGRLCAEPAQLLLALQPESAGDDRHRPAQADAEQPDGLGEDRLGRVLLVVDAEQCRHHESQRGIAHGRAPAQHRRCHQRGDDDEAEHLLVPAGDEVERGEQREDREGQGVPRPHRAAHVVTPHPAHPGPGPDHVHNVEESGDRAR
jgi:hypothetical protein